MNPQRRVRPAGVGLGFRPPAHERFFSSSEFDFVEVAAEDYARPQRHEVMDPGCRVLSEVAAHVPIVVHGSELSLGSAQPPDPEYVRSVAAFVREWPVGEFSEHLQFSALGRLRSGCFLAMPFTDLGVEVLATNARALKAALGVPLLLENVAYFFPAPMRAMKESEFITRVVEAADCGILLDVANAWINSRNFKFDLHGFIAELPAERVLQSHFCGGEALPDGFLLDSHRRPATRAVWDALEFALQHTALRALILERDDRFEAVDEVADDIRRARELYRRFRPAPTPDETVEVAPPPAATDSGFVPSGAYRDLELFQSTLLRMLHESQLCDAVDREGQAALTSTGLGRDEREALAAIPPTLRDRLAWSVRRHQMMRAGPTTAEAAQT